MKPCMPAVLCALLIAQAACAQNSPEPLIPKGDVVVGQDDKKVFADAPAGFDAERPVPHGELKTVSYPSSTVGNTRTMMVYLPPGYSPQGQYPVLYLMHGIGGDEKEWLTHGRPREILDNLVASKAITPMIVVLPNGRAQTDDRARGDIFKHAPAFAVFEQDLLKDVIPAIESQFAAARTRERRAIAGLSMGGGQSLNFGLGHPELFGWIGGFSSAPNTRPPAQLLAADFDRAPRPYIWLSCGDQDGLMPISQNVHRLLKDRQIAHVWHVDSGKHDWPVWKNDLYLFIQQIFK